MASSKAPRRICVESVVKNVIEILSSYPSDKPVERPDHFSDTMDEFCVACQHSPKEGSEIAHKLLNSQKFISLIIKHFKDFDAQISVAKELAKKPASYIFTNFCEMACANNSIVNNEIIIEDCLRFLINLSEIRKPKSFDGQMRVVFNRESHNLFQIISSVLSQCQIYRLHFGNKLFRFLQNMLPPLNTSKSNKFCKNFDVEILLERCTEFVIYRMHIDGDGCMCGDQNYNDLYGIKEPLAHFMDSLVSILTYFISSKWHKKIALNNEKIIKAIVTVCCRLCHELKNAFDLYKFEPVENLFSKPEEFQCVLNKIAMNFNKGNFLGHRLVIRTAMEYLYYYSLERDVTKIECPLNRTEETESFDSCWKDYQYVVALIRWVTQDKFLGLYLDTIAEKLGYLAVKVDDDVKDKKKEELICHQMYSQHEIHCFYPKCKKRLKEKKLKKCSGCKVAYYCRAKCQKADWKNHKQICKMQNDDESNDVVIKCENVGCNKSENIRRCTGCYSVWYCSIECQTENWKLHKKACKKKRKERQFNL